MKRRARIPTRNSQYVMPPDLGLRMVKYQLRVRCLEVNRREMMLKDNMIEAIIE